MFLFVIITKNFLFQLFEIDVLRLLLLILIFVVLIGSCNSVTIAIQTSILVFLVFLVLFGDDSWIGFAEFEILMFDKLLKCAYSSASNTVRDRSVKVEFRCLFFYWIENVGVAEKKTIQFLRSETEIFYSIKGENVSGFLGFGYEAAIVEVGKILREFDKMFILQRYRR